MKKNVQRHFDNMEKKFYQQYQKKLKKEEKNKSKASAQKPISENENPEQNLSKDIQ